MSVICGESILSMSRLSNEAQIWRKILCFSGIISDISEYIHLIFTIDGHLFCFLHCISGSRPGILGDFWQVIPNNIP